MPPTRLDSSQPGAKLNQVDPTEYELYLSCSFLVWNLGPKLKFSHEKLFNPDDHLCGKKLNVSTLSGSSTAIY